MATEDFKKGDRVLIREDSQYYRDGEPANPKGVTGTVDSVKDSVIRVKWDNGRGNTYAHKDLTLIVTKFKVGDIVLLSKKSTYYGRGTSNPSDVEGFIKGHPKDNDFLYEVKWNNGQSAYYNDEDLEPVTSKAPAWYGKLHLLCDAATDEGQGLVYDIVDKDIWIVYKTLSGNQFEARSDKFKIVTVDDQLDWNVYYPGQRVVEAGRTYTVSDVKWEENNYSEKDGIGSGIEYRTREGQYVAHNLIDHSASYDLNNPTAVKTKTETKTQKETKMSKVAKITAANTSALKAAAKMEAGTIAINRIVKMVTPKMPMMLRGYMDTPFGRVAVANMFNLAVQQYAAQNDKAQLVAEAMMEGAMLEMIKSFNIEEMINGVLDGIDITKFTSAE